MTAYAINKLCFLAERDPAFKQRLLEDLDGVLAGFKLDPEELAAIKSGDVATLLLKGGHPFLMQHLARHGIAGLNRDLYRERITSLADRYAGGGRYT